MKVRKSDIIWAYLARGFSIGVNILLLPMIMAFLSDTELALWYVFASISQVVNLFDFGFNATLARHMTYAWSGAKSLEKTSISEKTQEEHNEHLMAVVISTCRVVYFAISIVAFGVMLTAGSAYINVILDGDFQKKYLIAWIIYAVAVFLNLFYGYWSSLLQGIGAIAERNKMNVYSKIIQLVLAIVLLKMNLGLLGFVIAYTLSGISLRIIGHAYFVNKTKRMKLKIQISKKEIKECFQTVWFTAWKDGLVMLAQYLSTQANTLICAYFIDLSSTSSYGIITQIASVLASLAMALFSAYQPQYSSLCLSKNVDGQRKLTCLCSFIYKVIFGLGIVTFIFIGVPLLHIVRPAMILDIKLIIVVCLFYYLYNQHALFASMIASTNELPYYKSFVITAIGSVLLSIVFTDIFEFGLWGLVMGQIFVNLLYNNWKWPIYVLKRLKLKYTDIYFWGFKLVKSKVLKGDIDGKNIVC